MDKKKRDYQKEQAKINSYCVWCNKRVLHKDLALYRAEVYHAHCLKAREQVEKKAVVTVARNDNAIYPMLLRKHMGIRDV